MPEKWKDEWKSHLKTIETKMKSDSEANSQLMGNYLTGRFSVSEAVIHALDECDKSNETFRGAKDQAKRTAAESLSKLSAGLDAHYKKFISDMTESAKHCPEAKLAIAGRTGGQTSFSTKWLAWVKHLDSVLSGIVTEIKHDAKKALADTAFKVATPTAAAAEGARPAPKIGASAARMNPAGAAQQTAHKS